MNNMRLFLFVLFNGFLFWISPFAPYPLNYALAFIGLLGLIISFTNLFLCEEDKIL